MKTYANSATKSHNLSNKINNSNCSNGNIFNNSNCQKSNNNCNIFNNSNSGRNNSIVSFAAPQKVTRILELLQQFKGKTFLFVFLSFFIFFR